MPTGPRVLTEGMSARVACPSPTLTSYGGVGTVTGSRHLVEFGTSAVLVDCGLFQGLKELRDRNWAPLPVDVDSLDAVVITHAHLDHCGYLPRLVQQGVQGAGLRHLRHRQVDVGGAPRQRPPAGGGSRVREPQGLLASPPALPLYTEDDAWAAIELLQAMPFDHPFEAAPGIEVTFEPAGHILGSAVTRLVLGDAAGETTTMVCSGDLGRQQHPFLRPPAGIGDSRLGDGREHVRRPTAREQ